MPFSPRPWVLCRWLVRTVVTLATAGIVVASPGMDDPPPKVEGPGKVAPDELAGVVVDAKGKPIEGAEVDVWSWYPGNESKTDARGMFRIRGLDKSRKVEVVVSKEGYAPRLFMQQPVG